MGCWRHGRCCAARCGAGRGGCRRAEPAARAAVRAARRVNRRVGACFGHPRVKTSGLARPCECPAAAAAGGSGECPPGDTGLPPEQREQGRGFRGPAPGFGQTLLPQNETRQTPPPSPRVVPGSASAAASSPAPRPQNGLASPLPPPPAPLGEAVAEAAPAGQSLNFCRGENY